MATTAFFRGVQLLICRWAISLIVLHHVMAQGSATELDRRSNFCNKDYPKDCSEVLRRCSSSPSGVYVIKPEGSEEAFPVYCEHDVSPGGWTVIQRRSRSDNSPRFDRGWEDYKYGFGVISQGHWLGNEKVALLTNQTTYELRVDIELLDGSSIYVIYNGFHISGELDQYSLIRLGNFIIGGNGSITQFFQCEPSSEGTSCPMGFLLEGNHCVPLRECGCFWVDEERLILNGQHYANDNCTELRSCQNNRLIRTAGYVCSPHAQCLVRKGVRRCYCNEGYGGDGQRCSRLRDCADVYEAGHTHSGTYRIFPVNWPGSPFNVSCNMSDGGWTVFQRRIDGHVDFYLDWSGYKNGFGLVDNEHWLGNEQLFYLTNQRRYRLRVELVDFYGYSFYADYDFFRINNETDDYRLSGLGVYSGNAGDALRSHKNWQFSTKDHGMTNCAQGFHGAWWYHNCYTSNLNGDYNSTTCYTRDIFWKYLPTLECGLTRTEMKIRPV